MSNVIKGRASISSILALCCVFTFRTICIAVDPPATTSATTTNPTTNVDYSDYLPRIGPIEPGETLELFEITTGYGVQLVASEPLVRDPVAMSFDQWGRMYVVEMCDYSEQGDERLGNVRLLTDSNQDGQYESSTVFADGLSWPTAVICYDGGVFVGAAPDIWFIKDTDADGVADIRKRVFSGFNRTNVQGLLNSFTWGLDCRIYVQTSSSGGTVVPCDVPDAVPLNLSGRDFSFDPKTLAIRPEAGGAQHGMCFDDWGHRFASHNSDHLQQFVYDDRYASKRSDDPMPNARQSIAADGPQAEVFRISPVEPWRILRTHLRVSKQVPGHIEGGGRAAGYFTGATGATVYRGDLMPELLGQVFIGDVGSNIVHRKRLVDSGVHYTGERADSGREFIASKDIWFRPAQFANSPDGSLYIADFYREVIEHPASLPPDIKRYLDLTSGRNRGRIYRVVPESFAAPSRSMFPPRPMLGDASVTELVAALGHRNGWHRDTASRLLFESSDSAIPSLLTSLIDKTSVPEAKVHAMHLLRQLDALTEKTIFALLDDPHPNVRENAIVVAESRLISTPVIRSAVIQRLADTNPRVRFQAALTLSTVTVPGAGGRGDVGRGADGREAVIQMLEQAGDDRWLVPAALRAIARADALDVLFSIVMKPETAVPCEVLANWIGNDIKVDELRRVDAWLMTDQSSPQQDAFVRSLYLSLARNRDSGQVTELLSPYATLAGRCEGLIKTARTAVADSTLATESRLESIALLACDHSDVTFNVISDLLQMPQPKPVQLAAIDALSHWSRPEVSELFISTWPRAIPSVKSAMSRVMVTRNSWTEMLVAAVVDGQVDWRDLEPTVAQSIRASQSAVVKEQLSLISLSSSRSVSNREQVVNDYRRVLTMSGDVEAGQSHFQKNCAACHRVNGFGNDLGPNLAAFKFRGIEAILLNVLDPNREVNPQYVNYMALTNDDRIISGMLTHETATAITLSRGEKVSDTLLLSDIQELRNTQKSIMPEGFEQQLDHQAMADLFSYLMALP